MSRVTRFAGRDPGPAARMSGFLAHLRGNGLRLGVAETELALAAVAALPKPTPEATKRALKAVCTGCREEAERFDDLFDGFWRNAGRVAPRVVKTRQKMQDAGVRTSRTDPMDGSTGETGTPTRPDTGGGTAEGDGDGKLVASEARNLMRKDLRELVQKDEIAAAEAVARKLGAALRDRRSRRRRAAVKGDRLHFRRIIRQSLATGGEPIRLLHRRRPNRNLKIVALCDVSGSMSVYAQVFLAFLGGLMRADPKADAYLFHTRLVRITEALRDRDMMRAVGRMSLMADGFGGGSKIGACLAQFATGYARRFVNGRTAVLILSDGYDTDPPAALASALAQLKARGARLIWLNPLKGWCDYAPITAGMAAARPHLDLFAAANTLEDLAALEPELAQL